MRLFNFLMAMGVVLLALVLGVGFALANSEPVLVHYYVGARPWPLSLLVLGSLVLGMLIGWFIQIPTIIRLKMHQRLHWGRVSR